MVKRLSDMPDVEANHLRRIECPTYDDTPLLPGKPLAQRRVAIISTAGLHKRADRPFRPGDGSYRVIPAETAAGELVMSHISVNFDRTGFQQDLNVVFPIDRLRELVADRVVGSMASVHYSFMGAFPPAAAEPHAQHLGSRHQHPQHLPHPDQHVSKLLRPHGMATLESDEEDPARSSFFRLLSVPFLYREIGLRGAF